MNTYYDYINAVEFGHHCALEHQYNYFLNKYPHIFKYVEIQSRLATHQDYYVPPSIAGECKIYSIAFNEIGCRKISCFPKTSNLTDCTEKDPTTYMSIGNDFYLSCQPACHELSPFIDTEFKDGKCWQMNTEKKIFALFPERIHNIEIYQPMHKGLNLKNGDLVINQEYCTAFGLSFENDECIAPVGQEIAEIFLGSTIYKSLKKASIQSTMNPVPPSVPHDVQNVSNWLEGSQSMKHNTTYQSKSAMPYIPSQAFSDVLKEFMKDLAIDIGTDVSIDYSLKVMKKRIPQSVLKMSTKVLNRKIVQSAMVKAITQSQALTFAKVARGLFSTLSKINVAMSIFGVVSSVVDLFDPFNYNYVLDKETISRVNEHLDFVFYRSNNRKVEITPEKVWNLLEEDMSLYVEKLEEKIDYYLEAVKLEDYNSRSKIQKDIFKKKKSKIKYQWDKVFHAFFVMILIIASIFFIQYIAYFILIYFLFILMYPPSFY